MLSILSYAYLSSVYLLLWRICSNLLSYFSLCLSACYGIVGILYRFWTQVLWQTYALQIFPFDLQLAFLFPSVSASFWEHKFLILFLYISSVWSFTTSTLYDLFNKSLVNSISQRFSSLHLCISFITLILCSKIHFNSFLLIICGKGQG